jgi:ATP-binding cassette subfamily F protein 3
LSNIESKINQFEKDIKSDDTKLAADYDKTAADPRFFDTYKKKKKSLEQLMQDWENVQEQLDVINN